MYEEKRYAKTYQFIEKTKSEQNHSTDNGTYYLLCKDIHSFPQKTIWRFQKKQRRNPLCWNIFILNKKKNKTK